MFGNQFLIRYMACKYFLPFHRLSFYSVDCSFAEQKLFSLMKFHCLFFLFLSIF